MGAKSESSGADSRSNDASAASRKPAISATDSPLIRIASKMPPSSRSLTRPSSMAAYSRRASSRDMLRAPSLPRPISLMKRAAASGSLGELIVMAAEYIELVTVAIIRMMNPLINSPVI